MDQARTTGSTIADEGEAHLRSILATVPDAMVVIDESGTILSFSAAAEKMFGYGESEVVGENVSMLMPSPDRERHDGYLKQYRETGERKIIGIGRLTTARRRDGYTFPIELSVGEAWIGERRIFTGFIHDITQRQQVELRLQDLQSELAHVGRISEMGSLASSLAHELNQPLTAIANYCEAARDLVPPDAADEPLATIREALDETAKEALRAGQIVQRLRNFISHGDAELRSESLTRLVTEANALALVGSREHGIEVQIQLAPEADQVFVDRIQIQQVLTNLIRNGIDAMINSPVRSLTIRSQAGPEDMVTVSIEDTGSGISDSIAAQLFQPFVTSKATGMGVGLSICRTIVEAHGGRIWFEQRPGGGTIFHFTLPGPETVNE
jgi:two-component system sensor kinase FixL